MKKIYVNKTDSAASVIERVIKAPDKEVTLYVPRDTEFSRLKNNFRLLKRESSNVDKDVTIESVEDITLESAAAVGLKAVNPFFGQKMRLVSDIVLKAEVDTPASQQAKRKDAQRQAKQLDKAQPRIETTFTARELGEDKDSIWNEETERPRGRRLTVALIISAILLIGVGVLLYFILPEATINLTFAETPFNYSGPLVVNANIQSPSATSAQIIIPGTIFSDSENYSVYFKGSTTSTVSKYATGSIMIYNAYSSRPQVLVKTTRFTAPDGKIYRLDDTITVPGETSVGGKLVPNSITAPVTADNPGDAYNISTTTTFRIPGFQGTAKYDGFYGESAGPFTGGFVGVMSVPTDADISAARTQAQNTLSSTLESKLLLKLPNDVKILDGSSQTSMTSENISSTPNAQGQYSITVYGQIKIFAFRESDLLSALATEVASQSNSNLSLHDYSANYASPQLDFKKGTMTVSLALNSNWAQPFDIASFQSRAQGLDQDALKTLVFSLPGVKNADIKFWPFWVRNVPKNTSKIHVDVVYAP